MNSQSLVLLLLVARSQQWASYMEQMCETPLEPGQWIMGTSSEHSPSLKVSFERNDTLLACGSPYFRGETLTAVISSARKPPPGALQAPSPPGGHLTANTDKVFELAGASARFVSSSTGTDACGNRRSAPKSGRETVELRMDDSASGELQLRAAWAQAYGVVYITEQCTLVEPPETREL